MSINNSVKKYWEEETCGTGNNAVENEFPNTIQWYQNIENYRYNIEPFIFSVAQFSRHYGKKVLEIGVGAGTDHLQWARSGCKMSGVDLTQSAIDTTKKRFEIYGFKSNLKKIDAEELNFSSEAFDIVYSWGVIHHSDNPQKIIKEVHRVLKKDGLFIGMFYSLYSPVVFKMWLKYALMRGKPFLSFRKCVWYHMESIGTKAYTKPEMYNILSDFSAVELIPLITSYDKKYIPSWITKFIPDSMGWFLAFRAKK